MAALTAGSIQIIFGVDDNPLKRGLSSAEKAITDFSTKASRATSSAANAVGSGASSAVNAFGRMAGAGKSAVNTINSSLSSLAQNKTVQRLAFSGVAALGAFAIQSVGYAAQFETSMANVQAVTGATADEMSVLSQELVSVGRGSTKGVNAVADAYFNVASAVGDASARMPILKSSVALAEAGQADLGVATESLISAVNAYTPAVLSAEKASDVYVATVASGVGTLDQFASSMAPIAGLSSSVGVSFEDLGASMAFLTKTGQTTGAASTQLKSLMTELLRPSSALERQMRELGITNARAAIESDGLQGVLQQIADSAGGNEAELAKMFGSVEALQGIMALTRGDAAGFFDEFTSGVDGATQAAQAVQLQTAAAQFAMLKSNVEGLGVSLVQATNALGIAADGFAAANTLLDIGTLVLNPSSVVTSLTPSEIADKAFEELPDEFKETISVVIEPEDDAESFAAKAGVTLDQAQAILDQNPVGAEIEIETGQMENSMAAFRAYEENVKRINREQLEMETRANTASLALGVLGGAADEVNKAIGTDKWVDTSGLAETGIQLGVIIDQMGLFPAAAAVVKEALKGFEINLGVLEDIADAIGDVDDKLGISRAFNDLREGSDFGSAEIANLPAANNPYALRNTEINNRQSYNAVIGGAQQLADQRLAAAPLSARNPRFDMPLQMHTGGFQQPAPAAAPMGGGGFFGGGGAFQAMTSEMGAMGGAGGFGGMFGGGIEQLKEQIAEAFSEEEIKINFVSSNGQPLEEAIPALDAEITEVAQPRSMPLRVPVEIVISNMIGGYVAEQAAANAANNAASIRGFASGGYTGDGARNAVAGVVHKGEYVIPQGGALVSRGGGSGGSGITLNNSPITIQGVQNVQQLYDQLAQEGRRRGS